MTNIRMTNRACWNPESSPNQLLRAVALKGHWAMPAKASAASPTTAPFGSRPTRLVAVAIGSETRPSSARCGAYHFGATTRAYAGGFGRNRGCVGRPARQSTRTPCRPFRYELIPVSIRSGAGHAPLFEVWPALCRASSRRLFGRGVGQRSKSSVRGSRPVGAPGFALRIDPYVVLHRLSDRRHS